MLHWALSILSGVIVGFSLGLTGGGGSIFAVPLLVYLIREDVHLALGTSLASVGAISLIGAVSRIYHRQADLRIGAIFAACGMAGTYAGTQLNALVKGSLLLVLFALLMGVVATNMWRRSKGGRRGPAAAGEWLAGRLSRGRLMKVFAIMVWGIAIILLVENVQQVF